MTPRNFLYGLISAALFITACKQRSTGNYNVMAYDAAGDVCYATASTTESGYLNLSKKSQTNNELFFAQKGSAYYGVASDTGNLVKYVAEEGRLVKVKEIPFGQITGWTPVASWYSWVSDKELLIGSSRRGRKFMYALVDVETMRIIRNGDLDIPLPPTGMRYGGVMGRLENKTLYIAYMLYRYDDRSAPAGDTTYLASIQYPSMQTKNITNDARVTFPGGYNLFWQVSAVHNGYIYFITEPGTRLRFHPSYKPAVMRIRIGAEQIDPDYYFPLTTDDHHEFYGLFDTGNGQALIKALDKNKIKQFSDFFDANAVTYYSIDLVKKTKTKLNFPLDRLDFHPNVLRDDSLIRVAISSADNSTDIWSYSPKSNTYKKGLHLDGQVLFLNKAK